MKIKCPDCKKELENSDPNTLVNEYASHCAFDHPQISCGRFARQEFKIHEKIEYYSRFGTMNGDVQVLKSLLEDESSDDGTCGTWEAMQRAKEKG